jgi:hypothetical protein
MSLKEEIEKDRLELAELEAQLDKDPEVEEVEAPEELAEPEQPEEEAKAEPETEEKEPEKGDVSAWVKMRQAEKAAKVEAKNAQNELNELRERLARLEQPKEIEQEAVQEVQLPPQVQALIERDNREQAVKEFEAIEANVRANVPDYDDVAQAYFTQLAQANKLKNPRLSNQQIFEMTQQEVLVKAAQYHAQGHDAALELYLEAKELGIQPAPKEQPKVEKPDLAQINANKLRNAGLAAVQGTGQGGQITAARAAASDFDYKEWQKLSPEDKIRLLNR